MDLNFSLHLILERHRSLSQYLFKTFMNVSLKWKDTLIWINNLPWLGVLSLDVLAKITVGEPKLPCLNALLDSFPNLEQVYTRLGRGGSQKVLRRVENNAGNLSLAVSSLKLLNYLSSVGAVDFDDVPSLWGGGDQGSVWIHCHGSDLCVMCWDNQVDRLVHD